MPCASGVRLKSEAKERSHFFCSFSTYYIFNTAKKVSGREVETMDFPMLLSLIVTLISLIGMMYAFVRHLQGKLSKERTIAWLLSLLLVVVIVAAAYGLPQLLTNRSAFQPSPTTASAPTATPETNGTIPVPPNVPTALPSPTPTRQEKTLPQGQVLYSTNQPGASASGASCDGGSEHWDNYGAQLACQPAGVRISNAGQDLAGPLLKTLPNNASYPSNYILEAQIQADGASQADFGLYFRNQPGYALGIYTFLIHPNGSWGAYVYDNTTGAPTQIGEGSSGASSHALLTLDVVADGSHFTFYINGEAVGEANDATYGMGTTGIVVDAGGTITVSAFMLSRLL
jgi:hypothetical protein